MFRWYDWDYDIVVARCLRTLTVSLLTFCLASCSSSTSHLNKTTLLLTSLESANEISQHSHFTATYRSLYPASKIVNLYAQDPPRYVWRVENLSHGATVIHFTYETKSQVCSTGLINRCNDSSPKWSAINSSYSPATALAAIRMMINKLDSGGAVSVSYRKLAERKDACFAAKFIVSSKAESTTDCFTRQGITALSQVGPIGLELTSYSPAIVRADLLA